MAKTLKEIPTRSASAETKQIGVAMTLDDLDVDVRSQTVAESLERVMPPPAAPAQAAASALNATARAAVAAPIRVPEPATASKPDNTSAESAEKKKPTSQMLSTPIPAALKRRLNGLRLQHSISTAFVVEVALNEFFSDRTDDMIAADLQARGGRLRRNSG